MSKINVAALVAAFAFAATVTFASTRVFAQVSGARQQSGSNALIAQARQTSVRPSGSTVSSSNPQASAQTRQVQPQQVQAQQTRSQQTQASTGGSSNGSQPLGGYIPNEQITNAIAPPPADYRPTEEEQKKLDEFLERWENFGKGIKRISCDVHMREFDSVLQQNSRRPVAHTWGQFRFISPNKLSYYVKGEFAYTDEKPEGEWKEGQNEWKIVLDGKAFTQYDFKNKKAIVFPIAEEEQDMDLTMDNGQFPLFFVAKADVLKSRFYLRIVTPEAKAQSEVWLEAFPRYTRDAQQFKSIVVLLSLKDLQPTYMRKLGVNGKSKTELTFEKVAVNKGLWTIEGTVDQGWTKEEREETFSILNQQTYEAETGVVASSAPASNARTNGTTRQNGSALNPGAQTAVSTRNNRAATATAKTAATAQKGRANSKLY